MNMSVVLFCTKDFDSHCRAVEKYVLHFEALFVLGNKNVNYGSSFGHYLAPRYRQR